MDLVRLIKYVKANRKLLLVFFLLGLLVAFAEHVIVPPMYQAKLIMEVGAISSDGTKFIENPDTLAQRLNQVFSSKYPGFSATTLPASDLVILENTSTSKADIEKSLTEVSSAVLLEHDTILKEKNDSIDERIQDLQKREATLLRMGGQQVAPLELAIFSSEYDQKSLIHSRILEQPVVSTKKELPLLFKVLLGAVLGIGCGLVWLLGKHWWQTHA